jgi:hypothetical protein
MIVEKAWEYQKRIENWWLKFRKKNIKHLRILPKILLFFLFAWYHGQFIRYQIDLIWWGIFTVTFATFIFFYPFSKFQA